MRVDVSLLVTVITAINQNFFFLVIVIQKCSQTGSLYVGLTHQCARVKGARDSQSKSPSEERA